MTKLCSCWVLLMATALVACEDAQVVGERDQSTGGATTAVGATAGTSSSLGNVGQSGVGQGGLGQIGGTTQGSAGRTSAATGGSTVTSTALGGSNSNTGGNQNAGNLGGTGANGAIGGTAGQPATGGTLTGIGGGGGTFAGIAGGAGAGRVGSTGGVTASGGAAGGAATGTAGTAGATIAMQRCGAETCGQTQVCVAYRVVGGAVLMPDLAGNCPSGTHLEGSVASGTCVADFSYTCRTPSGCGAAALSCSCGAATCPANYNSCRNPTTTTWLDPAARLVCEIFAP